MKKNKKISEKSGLTSEREEAGGGVGMAFSLEAANRGGHGGFLLDQKHKKHSVCVQNIQFPANTERKRPKIDHKRPKIDRPP